LRTTSAVRRGGAELRRGSAKASGRSVASFSTSARNRIVRRQGGLRSVTPRALRTADVRTRSPAGFQSLRMRTKAESTYVMVKPDGVQRGLVGEIISRFERKGYVLAGLKTVICDKQRAEEHYKELADKPFFPKLVDYICSGPVVCMIWEGTDVVKAGRKLIGATNPTDAEPGTIRGDFGVEVGRNLVHGSDSIENGEREINLWFATDEVIDWEPTMTPWIKELS